MHLVQQTLVLLELLSGLATLIRFLFVLDTHSDVLEESCLGILQSVEQVDEELSFLIIQDAQWLVLVVLILPLLGESGLPSNSDHERSLENDNIIIHIACHDLVTILVLDDGLFFNLIVRLLSTCNSVETTT